MPRRCLRPLTGNMGMCQKWGGGKLAAFLLLVLQANMNRPPTRTYVLFNYVSLLHHNVWQILIVHQPQTPPRTEPSIWVTSQPRDVDMLTEGSIQHPGGAGKKNRNNRWTLKASCSKRCCRMSRMVSKPPGKKLRSPKGRFDGFGPPNGLLFFGPLRNWFGFSIGGSGSRSALEGS